MLRINNNRHDAINSCFGPNAWPHEVICPELVSEGGVREIDPQQWVNNVARRIPTWARGVLKTADSDALEETCQEFCLTMIKYRPDLSYDAQKASKGTFLARILAYTHWRTLRGKSSAAVTDGFDLDRAEVSFHDPAFTAEQRDLVELTRGWIAQLPESERLAAREAIGSTRSLCPSKAVRGVRLSRAIKRMRSMAGTRGLRDTRSRSRCVRFPRSRRSRLPNTRLIRRSPQQISCASDNSMANCQRP
ncbi:MAG TPA: hypothetical protein VHX86_10610 [Tepidisphaeraceae bacterium]|nr:hypothetical protein [Tepidisphaeraceae bacterium]